MRPLARLGMLLSLVVNRALCHALHPVMVGRRVLALSLIAYRLRRSIVSPAGNR